MNTRHDDKVVLITGAARGIGAELARVYAQAGAAVMATDILEEEGRATVAGIRREGGRAEFLRQDVCDEGAWKGIIAQTVERFGGLDVLVNNAGIEETGLIADMEVEVFQRLMDINVRGVFLGMKHAMRAMRPDGLAGNGGSILNIASVAALKAGLCFGPYGTSKAAVAHLTRTGAQEAGKLGWGIRVNSLCPGLIQTAMVDKLCDDLAGLGYASNRQDSKETLSARTPLGRVGSVTDVTNAALYLTSDAAGFVTGAALSVDGGFAIA